MSIVDDTIEKKPEVKERRRREPEERVSFSFIYTAILAYSTLMYCYRAFLLG